jgi:hypothetical protein
MKLHRSLALVFVVLALGGRAQWPTTHGQVPYIPNSDNNHDTRDRAVTATEAVVAAVCSPCRRHRDNTVGLNGTVAADRRLDIVKTGAIGAAQVCNPTEPRPDVPADRAID